MIQGILDCTSIPVMAKSRWPRKGESVLQESMGVDMIDESEVLTPARLMLPHQRRNFEIPFVCGTTELSEAVRRIYEGAAMIRTKGGGWDRECRRLDYPVNWGRNQTTAKS